MMTGRSGSEINVYGTGVNAVKFVLCHGKNIRIRSFIQGTRPDDYDFMGGLKLDAPVIRIEDAADYLKDNYTVVATSEDVYFEIKDILETEYSLVEYEDFEYYRTYGKKVAIVYGNCHSNAVKINLNRSKGFFDQYGIYPIKPIHELVIRDKKIDEYETAIRNCDLFIHQCVKDDNYFGIEYASSNFLKKLKKNCIVAGFPNLYRMPWFLFPQTPSYDDIVTWEGEGYFFRDSYIDRYKNELSVSDLYEIMMDDKLIPADEIKDKRDLFYDKLREKEKDWDIIISDYIHDSLQDYKLFYDMGHPSGRLINVISNRILRFLGIEGNVEYLESKYPMDSFEIPIYSCVKSALDLHFDDRLIRKYTCKTLCDVDMDRMEYIRQYLLWYQE